VNRIFSGIRIAIGASKNMSTRRDFLKKVGYTAPVILTMAANPSFASGGSGRPEEEPKTKPKAKKKKKKKKKKSKNKRREHHESAW